ncbi:MAG TPA: COR domain-containing protein [bacterium]|nr:COR domain-containing protein [bacterium]HPN43051.1 COR domain-containing protein [bacterium]
MEIKWEWLGYNIVCVYGNPIELPPIEIIQKGNKAIRDYYRSLKSEYKSLNEVKVLLIGDGGSGKTSLVKQMFGEKYDANEKQTHGILIRDNAYTVNDKTINAHFWDFGGQQIMHHTHQFFLSKRSIYILVLDCRKEQDEEYWLKHIQSFGGDSPILVVINKIDENPGFEINRKFLSEKYPSIQGYFRVSCQNGEGIAEFIKALEKAFTYVEHLNITWSLSWFRVKEVLQKMTEPFINVQRFCEICESQKIPNDSGRETLVEFLHDLGVVVHFKDFALRDVHVLEPKWVTGAVYRIINSQELAEKGGRLHLRLLDKILQKKNHDDYEFPADKHKYIIELMKKFELCYEIDHDVILLPNLLPVPEPEFAFAYDNCLRFIIEYDFLPKSIIPRFIIKMNRDIKDSKLQWRTGVVLADKEFESEAVIKVDERDKKIYIYVAGSQRREYFSIILFNLRDINSSFEKIDAVEKVPMPDQPAITVSYKHLLRLDKAGNQLYIPDGSDKEYSVKELLGYIQEEKSDLNEILKILRKLESQSESRESFIEKANKVLTLQPNVFGIGVNINAIIEKLFPQKSKFIDTIPGVKIIYK